jgi:uncharacterized protein DUF6789
MKETVHMTPITQRFILRPWQLRRAAYAGVLATVAYTIAMEWDMTLTGNRFNDIRFIQGMIGGKDAHKKRFSLLAWAFHLLNGALLGEIYAAFFKRFLPGPNWFKGAIFGELFILSAWWLTPFADKYHPMIKSGELPKLATWTSFLQNIVRHFIFGITLGLLYRDGKS